MRATGGELLPLFWPARPQSAPHHTMLAADSISAAVELPPPPAQAGLALCAGGRSEGDLATCYTQLPEGEPPEWIMLMPAGELNARDGRRWHLDDADAVAAETRRHAGDTDLVFDYGHQTDYAKENGQPAPAAGWIKALDVRGGDIWGRVDWTERARSAIAAREFRYVSPTFSHTRSGTVVCLHRAALTNTPALDLPALAQRDGGSMHEQLKRVLVKLGLTEGSEPTAAEADAVLARIDPAAPIDVAELAKALGLAVTAKAAEVLAAAKARGAELTKALGLAETATAKEVLAAAKAKAGQANDPNPAAFVPRSEFNAVASQLSTLQAERAEDKATTAVDEAVAAGKVSPATRDWAMAYAQKDLEGFRAYAATAPVIVTPATPPPAAPANSEAALTADELAVCRAMGITEKDFKVSRADDIKAGEVA